MNAYDKKLVYVRNRIVEQLLDSIDMYNNGQKEHLVDLLNRVSYTNGYTVDVACVESFYVRGTRIDNKPHVKIDDEHGFEIHIFKSDGVLQCEFCHYYLMTEEEHLAEARAEQDGERAMNEWANGYRPNRDYMDDPRGD